MRMVTGSLTLSYSPSAESSLSRNIMASAGFANGAVMTGTENFPKRTLLPGPSDQAEVCQNGEASAGSGCADRPLRLLKMEQA